MWVVFDLASHEVVHRCATKDDAVTFAREYSRTTQPCSVWWELPQ